MYARIVLFIMKSKIGLKELQKRKNIDKAMTIFAIIEPLSTLPQILDIYTHRSAKDVSFVSWLLYLFFAIIWLLYGLRIKNMPLIMSSLFWIATEALVVIGIVLY